MFLIFVAVHFSFRCGKMKIYLKLLKATGVVIVVDVVTVDDVLAVVVNVVVAGPIIFNHILIRDLSVFIDISN